MINSDGIVCLFVGNKELYDSTYFVLWNNVGHLKLCRRELRCPVWGFFMEAITEIPETETGSAENGDLLFDEISFMFLKFAQC